MEAKVTQIEVRKWKARFPGLVWMGGYYGDADDFAIRCIAADKLDCAPCDVQVSRDGWGNFQVST